MRLAVWLVAGAVIAGAPGMAEAKTQLPAGSVSAKKPKPLPNPERVVARTKLPASPPLPIPRPDDIEKPSATADASARPPDIDVAALAACMKDLDERGGEAKPLTLAETDADGPTAACFIPGPVSFTRVHQKDGPDIKLESAVPVRGTLALELASWIRDDLTAIAKSHGTGVAELISVGGYACRTRNHQSDAPVSEHASGNAFDVQSIKFTDGKVIELTKFDAATKDIRAEIQKSACARFLTVLGPGADASHDNHVHLDMRKRKADFRICQWNLE